MSASDDERADALADVKIAYLRGLAAEANLLRTIRRALSIGVTQAEVGKEIGISQSAVSQRLRAKKAQGHDEDE